LKTEEWQAELEKIKALPYVSIYEPSEITVSGDKLMDPRNSYQETFNYTVEGDAGYFMDSREKMLVTFTYLGDSLIHIEDSLYGVVDCEGEQVEVKNQSSYSGTFERGKKYIAYGKFTSYLTDTGYYVGGISIVESGSIFWILDYSQTQYVGTGENFFEALDASKGYKYNSVNLCGVEPYDKKSAYWDDILRVHELSQYSMIAMSVADAERLTDFYNGNAQLIYGNYFTKEDYEAGKFKCMIDHQSAIKSKLKVGDTIKLNCFISINFGLEGLVSSDYLPSYPDFWGNDFGEVEFEIIGIFDPSNKGQRFFYNSGIPEDGMMLIPENTMSAILGEKTMKEFRLGRNPRQLKFLSIEVEKEHLNQFLEEVNVLKEIEVTVYDQGYSHFIRPLKHMETFTDMLIVISLLGMVVFAGVYVYFVLMGRRIDAITWNMLGLGKIKMVVFLFYAIFMISIPASLIGGIAGHIITNDITSEFQQKEEESKSAVAYAQYYGESKTLDIEINYNADVLNILTVIAVFHFLLILFGMMGAFVIIRKTKMRTVDSRGRIIKHK
jgi:hypothetical protein